LFVYYFDIHLCLISNNQKQKKMKKGQLATSPSFGLLRIENIVSDNCIYCLILTGDKRGGLTCEYASTINVIPDTENLQIN
jgi:hypothetical protein